MQSKQTCFKDGLSCAMPVLTLFMPVTNFVISLVCLCYKVAYIANNIDLDQTAPCEQSDQGSYCLLP